jgi:hypothetical protein
MNTSDGNEPSGRALFFGMLSVLSPWAGYFVCCSLAENAGPPDTGGWGALAVYGTLMPLAVLIGVIAGFVGLARARRFRWFYVLPMAGLLEICGLVLWYLSRVSHR